MEGDNTPEFNADGFVTAPDRDGTLINDLNRFLDVARDNNVFVIPVLWNGALMRNQRYVDLTWDDAKLDSYINNALIVGLVDKISSCRSYLIDDILANGLRLERKTRFGFLGNHERTGRFSKDRRRC